MTDKDIEDYCKNCSVEPPAMRFKCPECKHNPDNKNNFAKDINVPNKEQIIIDINKCKFRDKYTNYCLAERDDIGESYTICTGTDCYFKQLARKTQECERMRYYLNKIRQNELSSLDIEWDEYITECDCTDYSNIITYVEYGLGERDD